MLNAAQQALVEQHQHLVPGIVARMKKCMPGCVDSDELVGIGNECLCQIVLRYRQNRAPLIPWIKRKLPFAIFDELRKRMWGPRGASERATITNESSLSYLCRRAVQGMSGVEAGNEATPYFDLYAGPEAPMHDEIHDEVERMLRALGSQERAVVELYYWHGLTLAEVGARLGVSESRVSQVHKTAIARMRESAGRVTAA